MLFYRLKKEFWEAFGVRERVERRTTGWSSVVVLHNINLIAVKSAMYADGRSRTSWDQIEVCGFVQIRRNSSV